MKKQLWLKEFMAFKATIAEVITAFLGILSICFGPIIYLAQYPEDFKDALQKEIEKFKEKFKSLFFKN